MNARTIICVVSFCVAMTGLFVANIFLFMMIGEVNRKREEGSLISYFSYTFPKVVRIFREYRITYPQGKLNIYAVAGFALAIISLVSVAVCFRIIG
jgi:hypothetical protein